MGIETFGVPAEEARWLDDGWDLADTHALAEARLWLADPDARMIILSGKVGTGKTLAAAWLLAQFWDETWRAPSGSPTRRRGMPMWVSSRDLGRVAPWDLQTERWEKAGLLVLDDLGAEEFTPRTMALLNSLIVSRHADGLRTVLTTNLDGGEFAQRYGQRATDRLRASGLDDRGRARWWVQCTGPSFRGTATRPRPPAPAAPEPEPDYVPPERIAQAVEALEGLADADNLRTSRHVAKPPPGSVAAARRGQTSTNGDLEAQRKLREQLERRMRETAGGDA